MTSTMASPLDSHSNSQDLNHRDQDQNHSLSHNLILMCHHKYNRMDLHKLITSLVQLKFLIKLDLHNQDRVDLEIDLIRDLYLLILICKHPHLQVDLNQEVDLMVLQVECHKNLHKQGLMKDTINNPMVHL